MKAVVNVVRGTSCVSIDELLEKAFSRIRSIS